MNFDAFLETAWADHGDRPQEVADRLAASLHVVDATEHVAPFARLASHVLGEHLGEFDRGIALLQALRGASACADDGATQAVAQRIATLRYAKGDTAELLSLPVETRICGLADAASMLSGRGAFGARSRPTPRRHVWRAPGLPQDRRPTERSPSVATISLPPSKRKLIALPSRPKA